MNIFPNVNELCGMFRVGSGGNDAEGGVSCPEGRAGMEGSVSSSIVGGADCDL